jgi:hypothetical protein
MHRFRHTVAALMFSMISLMITESARATTTTETWSQDNNFSVFTDTFTPINTNELLSIVGGGTYSSSGDPTTGAPLDTTFNLSIVLNGNLTLIGSWTLSSFTPELISAVLNSPISWNCTVCSVSGIQLSESPDNFSANYDYMNGETFTFQDLTPVTCGPLGCTPATPIPAAFPLFATGLGALGLLRWRRKRTTEAVPI